MKLGSMNDKGVCGAFESRPGETLAALQFWCVWALGRVGMSA